MKTCFKCGQSKKRSEFYRHPSMGDGLLGKCKACTRSDVKKNRELDIEKHRARDRARGHHETPGYCKRYRAERRRMARAHNAVARAIRDGMLFPQPCEICANKQALAHHEDYRKPLAVRWLCQVHHKERHRELEGVDLHAALT